MRKNIQNKSKISWKLLHINSINSTLGPIFFRFFLEFGLIVKQLIQGIAM